MKNEEILKELNDITNRIEVIKKQIEKPKFKNGKWYKDLQTKKLFFIVDFIDIMQVRAFGFDAYGNWHTDNGYYDWGCDGCTEATRTEVHQALKKEAVKRGLWGDVKIKAHVNPFKYESINTGDFITGLQGGDTFYNANGAIFYNGTWAEIQKTMTIDDLAANLSNGNYDEVINYITENKTQIIETLNSL